MRYFFLLLVPCLFVHTGWAQDDDDSTKTRKFSRFNAGIYVGTFFANKNTASLYDGYGWDWNGNRNNFANSFMNRKINYEYGGGNGGTDQIAKALNVNHGDWSFDETDMPANLKYNVAFLVGFQGRFNINKTTSIIGNINGAKLTVNGNFLITLIPPSGQPLPPGFVNYKTFSIMGAEQREMIQLGFQKIMGDDDKLNFFVEGGPSMTFVKFEKNQIQINNLVIPLTSFYDIYGYNIYNARNLTKIAFGGFGGAGMCITMNPKFTVQLVYDLIYEKIPLGANPSFKPQHSLGIRFYYNL